jgi:hypothetical protein
MKTREPVYRQTLSFEDFEQAETNENSLEELTLPKPAENKAVPVKIQLAAAKAETIQLAIQQQPVNL